MFAGAENTAMISLTWLVPSQSPGTGETRTVSSQGRTNQLRLLVVSITGEPADSITKNPLILRQIKPIRQIRIIFCDREATKHILIGIREVFI